MAWRAAAAAREARSSAVASHRLAVRLRVEAPSAVARSVVVTRVAWSVVVTLAERAREELRRQAVTREEQRRRAEPRAPEVSLQREVPRPVAAVQRAAVVQRAAAVVQRAVAVRRAAAVQRAAVAVSWAEARPSVRRACSPCWPLLLLAEEPQACRCPSKRFASPRSNPPSQAAVSGQASSFKPARWGSSSRSTRPHSRQLPASATASRSPSLSSCAT